MKQGKIWGQTELIHANGGLELHRLDFKKRSRASTDRKTVCFVFNSRP